MLGLIFGVCMIYGLRYMVNEPTEEINLCIVTSYLLFYVADYTVIHVSGAISVVTLGLCMSAYGKTVLSPGIEKTMQSVLLLLSRNIEALIFMMAGMLCTKELLYEKYIYLQDIVNFAVLFLMMYLIRGLSITVHSPILKRLGYGMKWGEIITMSFSGMKGAITIIFGLMAFHDPQNTEREKAFILCGCLEITLLSLIVDSFLVRKFVKIFKLEKMSIVQENLMIHVTSSIVNKTYEIIEDLKENDHHKLSDWEVVNKAAGSLTLVNQILNSTKTGRKLLKLQKFSNELELINAYSEVVSLSPNQILREIRRRFISSMKGIFWQLFEKGQCFRGTILILMRFMNRALDHDDEPLNDWEYILDSVMPRILIKFIARAANLSGVKHLFRKFLYDIITSAYDAATCFITAHTDACALLDSMEFHYDEEYIQTILQESNKETQKCTTFINMHITSIYPEIMAYVQTYKSSHLVLNEQRKLIKHLHNHGLIGDIEFERLINAMNTNLKSLEGNYFRVMPDTLKMLSSLFPHISIEELNLLKESSVEVMIEPEHYLYTRQGDWKGAFIILKGLVEESTDDWKEEQVMGDISGVQHLISSLRENITSAKACTPVIAIKISLRNLEYAPNVEKHIWIKAAERILMIFKHQFGEQFSRIHNRFIPDILNSCEFGKYFAGDQLSVENGALLLEGKILDYNAYTIIPPAEIPLTTLETDVILFHFPYQVRARVISYNESIGTALYHIVFKVKHKVTRDTLTPASSRLGQPLVRGLRFIPSHIYKHSMLSSVITSTDKQPPIKPVRYSAGMNELINPSEIQHMRRHSREPLLDNRIN